MGKMQQQHVVALALPAQGHINAMMRVCKLLLQHDGFIITVVDIDFIHHRVEQLHDVSNDAATAREDPASDNGESHCSLRRISFSIPGLDLSKDFNVSFRSVFEALLVTGPALLRLLRSLHPAPSCVLSDFTITLLTQEVADQLAIPQIVLYPFSASRLLLLHYVTQGKRASMHEVSKALATASTRREVFCNELPGLPTLYNTDLSHFKHVQDDSLYMWNLSIQSWQICSARARCIVVNSFDELEPAAFTALSKCSPLPVYGIGPLIETLHEEYATSLWREDEACVAWLDQQPASSVLFVSFGSITILSQAQFEELLHGLLASEQRFLWAFRPGLVDGSTCSSISKYIMSKSHGRGFVVDWAPQVKVLAHPSVAGFLTHCGWNSVTESVAHGVPMLCWPYFADQPLNARCIVDEWKLGLAFEASDENHSFIKRGEIERAIRSLMQGVEGAIVKKNVDVLKEACRKCLFQSGSSYMNLRTVVGSLT